MKFSNITSWLSGTDAIFGMEVHVNAELSKEFRLVKIVKKNGHLLAESFHTYLSVEEVVTIIPENSALVLVVNGKGVIHRTFTSKSEEISEIIKTVFPDIKAEDFFCQSLTTNTGGILSLVRKEMFFDILETMKVKKINCLALSLGPFVTVDFFQLIEIRQEELLFDYYHLKIDETGNIREYKILTEKSNDNTIVVLDEKIKARYLNAYSAACIYLLATGPKIEYACVQDSFFIEKIKKYKALILQKRGGLIFLGLILIVLLINFFVFSNLRKENISSQDHLAVYQSKLKRLDSLEKFIQQKKEFIEKAGWSEKVILSRQCDLIAQTVPADIHLTELTIHPINITESRNSKETIFINKKIIIKGVTKKVVVLNEWLKVLSSEASIRELKMDDYHFDTNTQEGQFKLEGTIE